MKFKWAVLLAVIILAYVINSIYLEIGYLQFTGIILLILILGGLAFNFLFKFKDRKKNKGEPNSYAFPDSMARFMKLVDQRTQYESALLSMFFILVGMILFTVYIVAFTNQGFWFKTLFVFNSFWGVILLGSFMVTQFQSYNNYMQIKKEMDDAILQDINKVKGGKNGI